MATGCIRLLRKRMPRTLAALKAGGWDIDTKGSSGHIRATHSSGRRLSVPSSPSGQRTDKRYEGNVRKIEAAAEDDA